MVLALLVIMLMHILFVIHKINVNFIPESPCVLQLLITQNHVLVPNIRTGNV